MDRLRIIAKQRELDLKDRMAFFFPLLVFAIRHSQRGSLALVTRGLSEKKVFTLAMNFQFAIDFFYCVFSCSISY